MAQPREYERTHPHLDFNLDLRTAPPSTWALLGEAKSKSEHIGRALLTPETAAELMQVYLAKGMLATTAIEGNTLSEDEVRELLAGELRLPPSREYLQREVQNVLDAFNEAYAEIVADPEQSITVERLCRFNARILEGLEVEDGVVPGELRTGSVVVGRYRAAPARDCEFLLRRLCEWLNGDSFEAPAEQPSLAAPLAIVKAVAAHLYLAWIHPFGDGNGRTARLLELQILVRAGFPPPACQLLSNHYNLTRADYYRQLDRASRANDELGFLNYAVRGFVDQLREQLEVIWREQYGDRWEQFVYQSFGRIHSETQHRRLRMVLALSARYRETAEPVAKRDILELTPELARAYAAKTEKTLSRDVNAVLETGLIRAEEGGLVPSLEQLRGLRPEVRGVLEIE